MNDFERKIKSELQIKLELHGWKFVTNMPNPNLEGNNWASPEFKIYTETLDHLRKTYLEVIMSEAYTLDGKPITNMVSIYARREKR